MQFQTKYNREARVPELHDGPILVDRAGYIPMHLKIERLLDAGAQLIQYQREQYDFPDGVIDEDYYPTTRRPNYDMADATAAKQYTDKVFAEAKREAAKKAAEKAAQEAANKEPKSVEKPPEK